MVESSCSRNDALRRSQNALSIACARSGREEKKVRARMPGSADPGGIQEKCITSTVAK